MPVPLSAKQVKAAVRHALKSTLDKWENQEAAPLDDEEAAPILIWSEYADPDTTDVGYV